MKQQKAYSVNDASGLNCNSGWLPGGKVTDYEKYLCIKDENKDTNKVYREDNQILDYIYTSFIATEFNKTVVD